MNVLYLLLPLALLLAGSAVAVFVWAVKNGQFDDLETPAVRILHDDDELPEESKSQRSSEDSEAS